MERKFIAQNRQKWMTIDKNQLQNNYKIGKADKTGLLQKCIFRGWIDQTLEKMVMVMAVKLKVKIGKKKGEGGAGS